MDIQDVKVNIYNLQIGIYINKYILILILIYKYFSFYFHLNYINYDYLIKIRQHFNKYIFSLLQLHLYVVI